MAWVCLLPSARFFFVVALRSRGSNGNWEGCLMDPFSARVLSRTSVTLSQLGFGGAPLGELFEKVAEATARSTVETAVEIGIRYFDTAPWYGHGMSEHRIGHVLRGQPRQSFVLSTKVGRVYSAPGPAQALGTSPWVGGLPFQLRFDYSYDGIVRSYEDSLHRLGLNRVDLLLIHDLDLNYHGGEEALEGHFLELERSGWKALEELKASGQIGGIGAGVNQLGTIPRYLDRFDLDFFLVAMPYTLLDQEPLLDEFPRCQERDVGIIIGAPFASGILATGAVEGAKYRYAAASAEVARKVSSLEARCQRYGVPLAAAALQLPLGHPSVAAVIPGAISPEQVEANVRLMQVEIPAELWQELKRDELLLAETPTP